MEIKIKEIRENAHLSQVEAAERMHISQPTYMRFESQKTNIDLQRIEDFAKAMNMSVIDVIFYPERFINIKDIERDANGSRPEMTIQIKVPEDKWVEVLRKSLGNNLDLLNS